MVTVNFKLADQGPVHLDIDWPEKLETILSLYTAGRCEKLGSVIVIRSGKVFNKKDLVGPNDTLDVYPAISGG